MYLRVYGINNSLLGFFCQMNVFLFGDNVLCRILIINTPLKTIPNQKEIGKYIQIHYLKCEMAISMLTIKRIID